MCLSKVCVPVFVWFCTAHAYAGGLTPAKGVCPPRTGDQVRQIEIFDGEPGEMAILAPDDHDTAPNTYTFHGIYEEGRIVNIRCKYDSGFVVDLPLKSKVGRCIYSRSKSGAQNLRCKLD